MVKSTIIGEIIEKNIIFENNEEFKLISPFACFVAGMTGSGKSVSVCSWLRHSEKVFRTKFRKIYYFFGSTHQTIFNDKSLKHVHFSGDLNLLKKIIQKKHEQPGILVVLDDLMNLSGSEEVIQNLYTKGSHHFNISVINIIQNIFFQSKNFVTLKENTQYIFLKQHLNENKLKLLAYTIGVETAELMEAYRESINKNRYQGILIDNHIASNIRKVSQIRDKLTSEPGLYITNKNFEYYMKKNVLIKINENNYYLNFENLKDIESNEMYT